MQRDEGLMERARRFFNFDGDCYLDVGLTSVADFARAERRRELESLRAWASGSNMYRNERQKVCYEIDRRLALLGEEDNGPEIRATDEALAQTDGEACGSSGGPRPADPDAVGSERLTSGSPAFSLDRELALHGEAHKLRAGVLLPAPESPARLIEDAEALERAAKIVDYHEGRTDGWHELTDMAAKFRASAATPAPDWAEELAMDLPQDCRVAGSPAEHLAAFLRERLGPVVERVESRAKAGFAEDVAALRKLEGGR